MSGGHGVQGDTRKFQEAKPEFNQDVHLKGINRQDEVGQELTGSRDNNTICIALTTR